MAAPVDHSNAEPAPDWHRTLPVYDFADCDARALLALEGEARALEQRALERNALGSVDFLLAACRHMPDSTLPRFVIARDAAGVLRAILPLADRRLDIAGPVARGWRHPFSVCGAPMIDADAAPQTCRALLQHLAGVRQANSLLFSNLYVEGATFRALDEAATALGLSITRLAAWSRAALFIPPQADYARPSKDRRRQRRRLAEQGLLRFRVAEGYQEVRAALETFLTLEAQGWKGNAGSALVQDPGAANFVRAWIWSLAARGEVAIAELQLDGRIIAATILVTAGQHRCLWKIAYDEGLAAFSPGVHLVLDLRQWLQDEGTPSLVDSCAMPGQWMIETLWPDRVAVCDVMISLDRGRLPAHRLSLARERLRRDLRARVKRVYQRLRGSA